MDEIVAAVRPSGVDGEIAQDRLTLQTGTESPTLRVHRPEYTPLSDVEPVATLRITGEDLKLAVELTPENVDDLIPGLVDTIERTPGEAA